MRERNRYYDLVEYTLDGVSHRPNGPASHDSSDWDWYLYGNEHRYYGKQSSIDDSWWIHGDCVKQDEED